uniref:Si:ch211-185a18.2 n=1 Tax=Oncorhynchus kisutch TaxID=8019 RepID=A0A8C7F6J8_ONCKI
MRTPFDTVFLRSQTAPLRQEVKVQLLDQRPPSSQEPQHVSGLSGDTGAASTAAVVTAAATAPLIKAQSDMEACVSQVWGGLQRLLESDRYPGRAQEAREDRASERVTQLEEQLNTVTQQRLQHLEWIQSQQMELQNRLLGSALSVVTVGVSKLLTGTVCHLLCISSSSEASPDPSSQQRGGEGKSPLETPAPRRVIPKPTRWNTTNKHSSSNAHTLFPYRECQNQQEGVRELVIAALAKHSDTNHQGRGGGGHQPGLPSSFGVPEQPSSAVKRANDTLQELGRLKTEMQTLLQVPPPSPQQSREEVAVVLPTVLPLPPARPTPTLLQQSRPCPSMFEDAERVLRQVQRHKKTLEENVEAMLRAKDGETLYSQLEALSCNRDTTEEVRIKKTVDAWINALSKDIQVTGRGQAESTEELNNRRKHTAGPSVRLRPSPSHQVVKMMSNQDGEEYLVKLYGKALYEGNRRTLKKGPYLRFNSPSPKSKAPRPRVVESVRGVKMKSSKTQTSLPHGRSVSSPLYPAIPKEPQYIFSPTRGGAQYHPGASLEGYLIPMAIPLGQPRVDGLAPQPSRVLISDQPVTTSMPPSPPRPAPAPRKPTVAVPEVTSGPRRRRAQLQVQVRLRLIEEEEELHDGPIELNGLASPPTAMYHGPVFPCYPAEPLPPPDPVLSSIQHRETLENRLVDWVEQQLMARMISEMYHPPLADPAQNQSPSHSEPEDSVTSDIVEAAGGEGLQLFVDTSVPVDSELIRQYVNEALAETIALMLGQREGQERPVAPAKPRDPPSQEVLCTVNQSINHTTHPTNISSLSLSLSPSFPLLSFYRVMSVAEEEPVSVPPVPPVTSSPLTRSPRSTTPPPPPGPQTPSTPPSSSSSSETTSSSSSSTVTGTDAAARHISEGELLLSYSQAAAARAFEEEGFYVPYLINSFSSSLQEVQDMDYDPPSEGQVRRPVNPAHHDPILSLLAKMDQGVITQTRPDPEESWEEEGEVSEGQRPRLHPAGERLVTGHSLTVQPWNRTEPNPRQGHVSSPGQLTLQSAGRTGTARQCFSFHSTSVPLPKGVWGIYLLDSNDKICCFLKLWTQNPQTTGLRPDFSISLQMNRYVYEERRGVLEITMQRNG